MRVGRQLLSSVIVSLLLPSVRAFQVSAQGLSQTAAAVAPSRKMSTSNELSAESTTIRVLALHGSEGTAEEFPTRLQPLVDAFNENHDIQMDITCIEGPFSKGQGYAWWTMPPGVRSFTANEYEGFELSSNQVIDAWKAGGGAKDGKQPFDLMMGHSQGAIMISALLALNRQPYHPTMGYILNGVAVPNPFLKQLEALKISSTDDPRILFLMGERDGINPNTKAEELRSALEKAGMSIHTIKHPGGHRVPTNDREAVDKIIDWVIRNS